MKVATEDRDELATVDVKGDQINGASTGELVVAKDARAPVIPCSFLYPRNDRYAMKARLQSPAGARADDKGGDQLTSRWEMHATIIEARIAKLRIAVSTSTRLLGVVVATW